LGDAEKKIRLQLFDILRFSGGKLGFNVFQKKKSEKFTKNKNFELLLELFFCFFNKFMLSECSLAISWYFYSPNYPKKSATATPLTPTCLKCYITHLHISVLKHTSIQT
jgi:hypothetical protein